MKKHEHYDVGLYLRLSKDDDVRSGDSSNITSQRTMLEKYARDSDIAPFRNILNQMYSNDLSKKVRSAIRTRSTAG